MQRPVIFIWLTTLCLVAALAYAQAPSGLEGTWEGALVIDPHPLRLVLNIAKASDGLYLGTMTSVDRGGVRIPMDTIQQTGEAVRLEVKAVNGIFVGTLSADTTTITGTWRQGGPVLPLEFTRTAAVADTPRPPDAATAANSPFGLPLEMTVPVPPTPFQAGGKTHLVYELHVTNFSARELFLRTLDVLHGEASLASFEGAELHNMLQRPGAADIPDKRVVGPGMRALASLWITLDAGTPVPAALRHRMTGSNLTVTGAAVPVSPAQPIVLGPPLRGANWIASNGPSNSSVHRRAAIPLNGHVRFAQRFAIDWVQIGPNGKTFDGDAQDNNTYKAYGQDILAVANGVVAAVTDGIPENVPGPTSRAVPITPETIGGNHVIVDLGGSRFAFYAHMQPGSVRVNVGDHVRQGQVLGLVGNSGNSPEPHLHFHVTDGPAPLESEGLPYLLESFVVQTAPNSWETRQNELPLQNARVLFPAALRPTFPDLAYADQSPAQKLDLYLPAPGQGPAPVVIWIHGGGLRVGDKSAMPRRDFGPPPTPLGRDGPYQIQVPDVAALTAKGYAVVSLNYRLGTSMALAAVPAVQDGKAAVRFLRAHAGTYQLDPNRFAVWGNSAGGYMAAMLGVTGDQATVFDDATRSNADVSSAVQAVVVWFGAEDRLAGEALRITHYLSSAKTLPAFLIANGDADPVIPPLQAQRLHDALTKAGATSTLTILHDAGHEDPAFMATQMVPTFAFLDNTFGR